MFEFVKVMPKVLSVPFPGHGVRVMQEKGLFFCKHGVNVVVCGAL